MKPAKVVNFAFLQEVKESHSSLWEDVNTLGSYVQEPFCADWIEQNAGPLLRRLREGLSSQFRLEETFGFVDGPGTVESPDVTCAIGQHLKLILHCVSLSEKLDDLEYCGRLHGESLSVWQQMKQLFDSIIEHETLERKILTRGRAGRWDDPHDHVHQPNNPVENSVLNSQITGARLS